MGTLYEDLISSGLPIAAANERTTVSILPGVSLTENQRLVFERIIRDYIDPAYLAEQTAAKSAILTTAQSAVGVKLTDLTAAQIKALMACMLYAAGGVDLKTMTVKPLSEWVK